jgi:alpha-galactosidase
VQVQAPLTHCPVSWEAMYFDVSEEKIIERLAVPAAALGIPLVVLDDGWFGQRNNDRTSLVRHPCLLMYRTVDAH